MRPREDRGRPSRGRGRRPTIEGLEHRELLSAASVHVPAAMIAHPASPNGLIGMQTPGPFANRGLLDRVAASLYHPGTPPGTPTPREIQRQTFTARWIGRYTIGPPRFADRASTIHLWGTAGGSNQFSRGKFQVALFPPANPGATPTPGNPYAGEITGFAALFAQNYLQSGSITVLDLNGTPAPGSAPDALPTRLSWSYDYNTSAGPYAAPGGVAAGSGFTQGAGEAQIQWIPDAHPQPGTGGSGEVVVTFQGLIHTSQIASGVSKLIS